MRYLLAVALAVALVAPAHARAAEAKDGAYCYFRRASLTWLIGNEAVERTVRFDPAAGGLRTEGVAQKQGRARAAVAPGAEGEIVLAPAQPGGSRQTLRLDSGWSYAWQIVATPAHQGRMLTVHLQGVGANRGFELEAIYTVRPRRSPFVSRSLTLINRSGAARTVESVTCDRWLLTTPAPRGERAGPPVLRTVEGGAALHDAASMTGLVVALADPGYRCEVQDAALVVRWTGAVEIGGTGKRAWLPPCSAAAFDGSSAVAAALIRTHMPL